MKRPTTLQLTVFTNYIATYKALVAINIHELRPIGFIEVENLKTKNLSAQF